MAVSPDGLNAYVASLDSDAIAIFDRNPATGELTQKAGTAGCVSETGDGGTCANGRSLLGVTSVVVSPDGTSVYSSSNHGDAVAIFDRNTSTGALTQKAGTAGCISDNGTLGTCVDGVELRGAIGVSISPDGKNVYIAADASSAVAIFDRNTSTGALTQKAGTAGCISDTGSAGACIDGRALNATGWVTISPDGEHAYVASFFSDAVSVFDRNTGTGALTQKAGTAGCISETGSDGCADGRGLDNVANLEISADGQNVYGASIVSNAVSIFDRNTNTGALTQKAGTDGCISETGAGPCVDGRGLDAVIAVTVSPDGSNVYAASLTSSTVPVFDRSTATGGLTQDPGVAGCIGFGSCTPASGVVAPHSVAVSPDGRNVYAASIGDRLAILDRASSAPPSDLTPPDTEITEKPKKKIKTKRKKARVSVSFSSEPGAIFMCALDERASTPCGSPFRVKAKSKPGKGRKHTISIEAIDSAGNIEPEPAAASFRIIRRG